MSTAPINTSFEHVVVNAVDADAQAAWWAAALGWSEASATSRRSTLTRRPATHRCGWPS